MFRKKNFDIDNPQLLIKDKMAEAILNGVISRDQEVEVGISKEEIKFKRLTNAYKEGLIYIAQRILEDVDSNLLKKTFKKIERGV